MCYLLVRRFPKTKITSQERLSVQGLRPVRKIVYAGFEVGRIRELKYNGCRAKIAYPGIEAGKRYCLCRD